MARHPFGEPKNTKTVSGDQQKLLHENACFVCRKDDIPTNLVRCSFCPKAYHFACLPHGSVVTTPRWGCPCHKCKVCGAATSSSRGKLYRCVGCPSSFCYGHLPPESIELDTNPYTHLNYYTRSFAFIYCNQPTCSVQSGSSGAVSSSGSVGTKRKAPQTLAEVLEFITPSQQTTTTTTIITTTAVTTTRNAETEGETSPKLKRYRPETSEEISPQRRMPTVSLQLRGESPKKRKRGTESAAVTTERHTKPDPELVRTLQEILSRRNLSQQHVAQQIDEKGTTISKFLRGIEKKSGWNEVEEKLRSWLCTIESSDIPFSLPSLTPLSSSSMPSLLQYHQQHSPSLLFPPQPQPLGPLLRSSSEPVQTPLSSSQLSPVLSAPLPLSQQLQQEEPSPSLLLRPFSSQAVHFSLPLTESLRTLLPQQPQAVLQQQEEIPLQQQQSQQPRPLQQSQSQQLVAQTQTQSEPTQQPLSQLPSLLQSQPPQQLQSSQSSQQQQVPFPPPPLSPFLSISAQPPNYASISSEVAGEPPIFQLEDIFSPFKEFTEETHNPLEGGFTSFSNAQYKPPTSSVASFSSERKPQE